MTVKKAHFNEKVWIDEQAQTKGPLRAHNAAFAEGWERIFGKQGRYGAPLDLDFGDCRYPSAFESGWQRTFGPTPEAVSDGERDRLLRILEVHDQLAVRKATHAEGQAEAETTARDQGGEAPA